LPRLRTERRVALPFDMRFAHSYLPNLRRAFV
jgi:hypothetical protein